jgi:hypothetical protein
MLFYCRCIWLNHHLLAITYAKTLLATQREERRIENGNGGCHCYKQESFFLGISSVPCVEQWRTV